MSNLFQRKNMLYITALVIVVFAVLYAEYLAAHIARDEKERVETWVEAQRTIMKTEDNASLTLAAKISSENTDIPIIETDENDHINPANCLNLDSLTIATDSNYLKRKLKSYKKQHDPIILELSDNPYTANKYYYGDSKLQLQVRYYPIALLLVAGIFILIIIRAQQTAYKSEQNQLWAGMAKETAHQLGTPVTSLKGWIEVLKENELVQALVIEMEKDVDRLELISDRFGKIGSQPQLEEINLASRINIMIDYIRKRAGGRVKFIFNHPSDEVPAVVSPPLFDWVMENLLKNALDAMEGKGTITVNLEDSVSALVIDVSDTGKGISKQDISKVFNPGFSTKKRGWGLGLTLSKRIIEQYHKGSLTVKQSEPGKGTTFRIVLNK